MWIKVDRNCVSSRIEKENISKIKILQSKTNKITNTHQKKISIEKCFIFSFVQLWGQQSMKKMKMKMIMAAVLIIFPNVLDPLS